MVGASQDFHDIELPDNTSGITDEIIGAGGIQEPALGFLELLDRVSVSIRFAMRRFRIFICNRNQRTFKNKLLVMFLRGFLS